MGLPHEPIEVHPVKGAHKSAEFLKLNPFGQVPVLDDGDTVVVDSNAILVYVAAKFDPAGRWPPRDPKGQAVVQAWFSVATGQIAFSPGAARLITLFGAKRDAEDAIARAHALLKVMDARLGTSAFLTGIAANMADAAATSYISAAPEGNVDRGTYANVRAWLARVEAVPGLVAFQKTAVGVAA
jgi:glutathione S-transferase